MRMPGLGVWDCRHRRDGPRFPGEVWAVYVLRVASLVIVVFLTSAVSLVCWTVDVNIL
jgi:hypothetical protein